MQRSQHLSWVFLNNKNNRMFFVSALVIIFLIALPFLLFELYTQTRGLLNLTALDKRVVTPENVQTTLKEVDDYLSSYSLNTSILQTQLEAFNQIPQSGHLFARTKTAFD